jgi:hypothetical protein
VLNAFRRHWNLQHTNPASLMKHRCPNPFGSLESSPHYEQPNAVSDAQRLIGVH